MSNSKKCLFPFMNGWKIELSNLPKYEEFLKPYTELLDAPLLNLLYDCEELANKPEIRANLKNVIDKIDPNTGVLKVNHYQAKKCGRVYADKNISIIPLSKFVKHTMFQYLGWLDIDMVKGHPTIAVQMGKAIGLPFPAI